MRTREIQTLSPSIEAQEKGFATETTTSLKEFNKRGLRLLENPLAEYGNNALTILDMKNTTKDEETSISLGKMFGIKNKKLWEMITNDRENKQIENMLKPFGLQLNGVADDYKLAIAA